MDFIRHWICLGCAAGFLGTTSAQESASGDLTELSLTDLLNVEVTSVSRSAEKLSTAPAAITVISGEDIRRTGATTIPDALRLVPGMQVAQVDSHTWAVSSRGFNDVLANKLLVMIDGRTVYTPLFSGVFWDVQDTFLEDIDRIEVIRGPGAALWGANAVNGVINVVTKSAKETQGLLVSGGTGTEELGFGQVRYGAKINDEAYARVYAKYFNRDHSRMTTGESANDRWEMYRGGFRVDWQPRDPNLFMFQGDVYGGTLDQTYNMATSAPPFVETLADDLEVHGGNVLARWTHTFSADSEMVWQIYFDHSTRNTPVFQKERDSADIDFQHHFLLGERQTFTWGGGYRRIENSFGNTPTISLVPDDRSIDLYSAFLQDEIELVSEKLNLTIGSKFEHNDFTGFEIQPSARVAWTLATNQVLWAAVSRAVRTPSLAEDDIVVNPPGAPPGAASLLGDRNFDSEDILAYEVGFRYQPRAWMALDIAAFYNEYDNLRSFRPLTENIPSPQTVANDLEGETYGVEISSSQQMHERWRMQFGYTYLQMQMHLKNGSMDVQSERAYERNSPHHQFFARSSVDFGRKRQFGHEFAFDTLLRYVDVIEVSGVTIPSYWTADVRLGWRPHRKWEISIVGKNLLDNQHPEFFPTIVPTQRAEIERSVYAKITFHF
ncbi:MAG: TonB-dependent receptor [Verrucomicrobia bacterium]|nr:TonB-dependent receptor [Verrucomicrobiota bacterium]